MAHEFRNKILYPRKPKESKKLSDSIYFSGAAKKLKKLPIMFQNILPEKYKDHKNVYLLKKISIKKDTFTSLLYQNNQNTDDHFVKFTEENNDRFGEI